MAESTTEDKAKFWAIFGFIIVAVIVGAGIFAKWYKNTTANANAGAAAKADASTGSQADQNYSLTAGRGVVLTGAARAIFEDVTNAHWYNGGIDNNKLYAALNTANSAQEMQALQTIYNQTISNNTRQLKADVDSSDFFDSSKVSYYDQLT